MRRTIMLAVLSVLSGAGSAALALPREGMIQEAAAPGAFCIADQQAAAPIVVDPADFPGVTRAANDLAQDIQRVTGTTAAVRPSADATTRPPLLVGTIGKSPLIDGLIKSGKLNVDSITGQWESYCIAVVNNPTPTLKQALVIAGSDKRGTIYGIYDVSENIGVSPWYWWADVPPKHREALFVQGEPVVQGPPKVKYRGIFLNDEAPCLTGWAHAKFGGLNSNFYAHVFELLLRLHANYLWPAMWGNDFNEDDPKDAPLADEYGIVMGTSHQEPMLRSQAEFDRRFKPQLWNYATHPDVMEQFWHEGVRRNKNYESLITMGMRGRNDTEMLPNATIKQSSDLLETIVARQRRILAEEVNPDVTKIPQVWCLYKEVMDYYDHGLRVPDDITLLWSDDNWGNLRRVPTAEERRRSGGAGIYYHFDYVGGPRSYKWLNTNPLPKVQEQLNIAYEYGADRIWVVNAGDLKPMELPIQFFMTMAWNPPALSKDKVDAFTRAWAAEQFGPEHADEIADIVRLYGKYNGWRKPELIDPKTFSLIHYNEAERVEAAWTDLVGRAEAIDAQLPAAQKAAYFQLVLYPVKACATVTQLYIAAGRQSLYAKQGRASANLQAQRVRDLFAFDKTLSDEYQHLNDGEWAHMMSQTHIGFTSWSDPRKNQMPAVSEVAIPDEASMGVAVEGSEKPATDGRISLPAIDSLADQHRWIDIFARGSKPVHYTVHTQSPWVRVDEKYGDTTNDRRVNFSIDWDKAPRGSAEGTLTIAGDNGQSFEVAIPVVNDPDATAAAQGAYGCLTEAFTIPANAASKQIAANGVH
ncbi:MAG: glycosyl hydrolase 115 family protein, partial [Tepidisphaeraceae bacterium]